MPFTPNLNIEHLDANSDQPEVVVDAAFDAFDAKITGVVAIAIDNTNVATLTQTQQAAGSIFVLGDVTPGSTGAFIVNFAAFGMGLFSIYNSTGHTATLRISGQPAVAPTLAANTRGLFQNDGVNVLKLV